MKNRIILFLVLLSFNEVFILLESVNAQELRSGEITAQIISPISDFHVSARVVIYVESLISTRPYIHLNWGDGTTDSAAFNFFYPHFCNIKYFIFNANHYYTNYGNYTLSIDEPFYLDNINNIINSSSESFKLQKEIKLQQELISNSSAIFTNKQDCEWTCCNWIHNGGAFDPDGDSLSYELVPCIVSNYIFPNATIDSISGDLHFYPDSIGKYAIAYQVKEWRYLYNSYQLIGATTRQMLLNVNSILSVDDNEINNKINLYPNPAINKLDIKSSEINIEIIKIYDAIQKEIYSKSFNKSEIQLDISFLENGLYFMVFETKKGKAVKKFVKQ
jgi:hypothetical protein